MVVWKPERKKAVHGLWCPVFKWSTKSCDFNIWILDTHTVWYSDESGIQMFSFQMVTVPQIREDPFFFFLNNEKAVLFLSKFFMQLTQLFLEISILILKDDIFFR